MTSLATVVINQISSIGANPTVCKWPVKSRHDDDEVYNPFTVWRRYVADVVLSIMDESVL